MSFLGTRFSEEPENKLKRLALRFAYCVLAANQLVAVCNAVKFRYDDGRTFLLWETGERVDHAVWFTVFIVMVTVFNLLRVRVSTQPKLN